MNSDDVFKAQAPHILPLVGVLLDHVCDRKHRGDKGFNYLLSHEFLTALMLNTYWRLEAPKKLLPSILSSVVHNETQTLHLFTPFLLQMGQKQRNIK